MEQGAGQQNPAGTLCGGDGGMFCCGVTDPFVSLGAEKTF